MWKSGGKKGMGRKWLLFKDKEDGNEENPRAFGTGFMTGVKSVRSMELRQIVSGAADVPFWRE